MLAQTSRGPITLICSDIKTKPIDVLELYCGRVLIEVMFDRLKNLLGIMQYHFWSMSITPQSRRPHKNGSKKILTEKIKCKKQAILNFVHIGLVLLLSLQAFACEFGTKINDVANCWLRTQSETIPFEFIAKIALRNIFNRFLWCFPSNPIAKIIQNKKKLKKDFQHFDKAG
ncbi:MAG: hypothetical protein U9O87_03295 [Verrucomicrobiota bacterium]|nr:hypothetical protein [Verrucomicrobiota bacterium]